jgi:hypothetical protein
MAKHYDHHEGEIETCPKCRPELVRVWLMEILGGILIAAGIWIILIGLIT